MKFISPNEIIYRLSSKINKHRYSFLRVPGMMGYDERMNLYETCRSELSGKGVAVEFGSFFGASSAAIQQGLRGNRLDSCNTEFHVVDCFRSSLTSEFSQLALEFSRLGQVDHLLTEEDGWLNFYKAFLSHVDATDPKLIIHQCFLSDFVWESKPVEFLHLDMPKDWTLASSIATKIFPDLVTGAKVLFQDFGYQWSAELIAMIGNMINMGLIHPYRLTDTTLSVDVVQPISKNAVAKLEQKMSSPADVILGIESARSACRFLSSNSIDATLSMAKAQYQYSQGDTDECFNTIGAILHDSPFDLTMRERLADLFQRAFIFDKSYVKLLETDTLQQEH